MANLRQMEPNEVEVGGRMFYIRPFPAFKAANLTGELANVLAPVIASILPLAGDGEENQDIDIMDIDLSSPEVINGIGHAFDGISGDKTEKLLRQLLLSGKNVAFKDDEGEGQPLTEDWANEIFCENVQDMFVLAFHVIRMNFKGFFKKSVNRFGNSSGNSKTTERAIL